MNIPSPAVYTDISVIALESAVLVYEAAYRVRPTTVIYGRNSAPTTLALRYGLREHPLFEAFRYWIEVPDLPGEMWFVCGPEGIYGSPGA